MVTTNELFGPLTPSNYTSPSFPSLYWPLEPIDQDAVYLYYRNDIWKFTLYWTLIVYGAFHIPAGLYAFLTQPSKLALGIPVLYAAIGAIEATIAGSIVGVIIAAVYNAGYFRMSTWIPLVWGVVNALVLLVSSFSLQGGL